MIPKCYPIGVEPIDTKELTGYSLEEIRGLDHKKLSAALVSINDTVFSKYVDAIDGPNMDEKQLNIIKNFRILLNRVYEDVRASAEGLTWTETMCEKFDYRWAGREKCLTDNFVYIFPSVTSPKQAGSP